MCDGGGGVPIVKARNIRVYIGEVGTLEDVKGFSFFSDHRIAIDEGYSYSKYGSKTWPDQAKVAVVCFCMAPLPTIAFFWTTHGHKFFFVCLSDLFVVDQDGKNLSRPPFDRKGRSD